MGRRERKLIHRGVEKAAGDDRDFIPSRGCGLADGTSSDAMPDAAGSEEVTGPLNGMP
jgi:hypothetical protein